MSEPMTAAGEQAEQAWRADWGASVPGQGRYTLGHEAHRATFIRGYDAALAAAEAPGRVAALEAACSDRGCLHYDHEQPPCVGHMPSICCAKLSASIAAAAVADYRDVTPTLTPAAEAPGRVAALEAALETLADAAENASEHVHERANWSAAALLAGIRIARLTLAAPASPAGVSYPRVPLTEGYVWCESCTGQGVLQKVEPLAPAPTPSEPVER